MLRCQKCCGSRSVAVAKVLRSRKFAVSKSLMRRSFMARVALLDEGRLGRGNPPPQIPQNPHSLPSLVGPGPQGPAFPPSPSLLRKFHLLIFIAGWPCDFFSRSHLLIFVALHSSSPVVNSIHLSLLSSSYVCCCRTSTLALGLPLPQKHLKYPSRASAALQASEIFPLGLPLP